MIDPNVEKTLIKITLSTGQSTTLELNVTHTVGDIHTYVMSVNPNVTSYQLLAGYPPAPLTDASATVKDAKLYAASVV